MDRLKKTSTVKDSTILGESKYFTDKDMIKTNIPMLNVAFSGKLDGGFVPGLTVWAGPSKHFKTNMCLICAAAFLNQYEDGIVLLYDSEFGITPEYLKQFNIDPDRVLHTPVEHVEQLKFDMVHQIEQIERKDKVMIVIDSIGNLASKKELEDAQNQKSVADMSRAKALKSLFRIVTPSLTTRDIPLFAINHTYKEQSLFPKDIVSGGTGIYYSANQIFIMGRRQVKEGKDIVGYDFVINVEKSRYVKEKSQIPITANWESGVSPYSGLLDVALATGFVIKPSNGWYQRVDTSTGEIIGDKKRLKDLDSMFWEPMLENESFKNAIRNVYQIGGSGVTLEVEDIE